MAKKIGDVAIALVILTFLVMTFSSFINEADVSEAVSSGVVRSRLNNLSSTTNNNFAKNFQNSVDDSNDLEADPTQQLERRGDSSGGLLNSLSKNVLVKFFKAASSALPQFASLFILLSTLVGITITILLLRLWKGEGKI